MDFWGLGAKSTERWLENTKQSPPSLQERRGNETRVFALKLNQQKRCEQIQGNWRNSNQLVAKTRTIEQNSKRTFHLHNAETRTIRKLHDSKESVRNNRFQLRGGLCVVRCGHHLCDLVLEAMFSEIGVGGKHQHFLVSQIANSLSFPAVTFCNYNRFMKTKLEKGKQAAPFSVQKPEITCTTQATKNRQQIPLLNDDPEEFLFCGEDAVANTFHLFIFFSSLDWNTSRQRVYVGQSATPVLLGHKRAQTVSSPVRVRPVTLIVIASNFSPKCFLTSFWGKN